MPLQKEQLSRMTIHGFKSIKSCDISFGKRISRYLLVKAV